MGFARREPGGPPAAQRRPGPGRSQRAWGRALVYLLVLATAAAAAGMLVWRQQQVDEGVRQRFVDRAELAAQFVSAFTTQVLVDGMTDTHRRSSPREDGENRPLRQYLRAVSSLPGYRGYLIGPDGRIVASSRPAGGHGPTLARQEPALAGALADDGRAVDSEGRFGVAQPVPRTELRLILSVPDDQLLLAAHSNLAAQTIGLGVLTGIALLATWLGFRTRDQRRALQEANERLELLANVDALTQLHNRRSMDRKLGDDARPRRQAATSVLLIDVDHFKQVNDRWGHSAGDGVLVEVASRISSCVRTTDSVARWGGEEFLVLLPDTDVPEAAEIAERIRQSISSRPFRASADVEIRITVSIGCHGDSESPARSIVDSADRHLYAAKQAGRNRVVVGQPLERAR